MTSDCVCKEYSSLQEDDPLWQSWERLLPELPEHQRFITPGWFSAWNETDGNEKPWNASLKILAVSTGESLNGLLILKGAGRPLLRLYSLAGVWKPWRAVLIASGKETEVSHSLVHHLMKTKFNLIRLGPCPGGSPALNKLLKQLEEHGFTPVLHLGAPTARFFWTGTWDGYQKEVLGRLFCKDLRRCERRLAEQGQLDIRHFTTPVAGDPEALVNDLAVIEGQSWLNSKTGSPWFSTDTHREFWTRVIKQGRPGICDVDIWVMYLDSAPISFLISVSAGKIRWLLATSYDQDFSKHSTGSILFHNAIKDGLNGGREHFEFGAGSLPYKRRWGAEYTDGTKRYAVLPRGVRGKILSFCVWLAGKIGVKLPL